MSEVQTNLYSTSALSAPKLPAPDTNESFRNHPRAPRARLLQADQLFLSLVDAYQSTGGVAWVGDLEAMFMLRSTGSARDFSDSIADRQVVHFEWKNQVWLPLFQFDLVRMQTHPVLAPVLSRLTHMYSDWEIADWFSRVNPWLKGRSPAQSLIADRAAVIDAASAEVFIACG